MTGLKNVEKIAGPNVSPQDTGEFEVSGAPLHVEAYGRTDRGQLRKNNEDQFLIAELAKILRVDQTSLEEPEEQVGAHRGHLFLVADGMGGYAGGEIASRIATRTVEECLLDSLKWFLGTQGDEGDELGDKLQEAVTEADQRVIREAVRKPQLYGMGSTLTLALHVGRELFVAHVGDSRAYLCRDGRLFRLTRDHTLLAELARRGQLTPEQEKSDRLRHTITNAVGGTKAGARADLVRTPVEPGDWLLLCTDGLTNALADDEIAAVLTEYYTPPAACERLVALANERGGDDNITVVVAAFSSVGR
jgi:protein phosphatase